MLAPRSHNASAKRNNPMVHGLVKAPGSSFFCTRPCKNSTTILYLIIILKTYRSLLSNHIFHKLNITRHLLKSFYQRDIDGKLFQHSNKMSVFTILGVLHQCLRNGGGGLGTGVTFWGIFASFTNYSTNSPLTSTTHHLYSPNLLPQTA